MNRAFKLALGLAAIDGLSSAFVAMLLLALTLIGSGEGAPAAADSTTSILFLEKSVKSSAAMRLQLQLALYIDGRKSPIITLPSDQAGLRPIPDAAILTDQGSILWSDCQSELPSCTSKLVINKPQQQPKCWIIALRPVGTPGAHSDVFASSLDVKPTMFAKGGKEVLKGKDETVRLSNGSSMKLKIDFSRTPVMELTTESRCPDWR